MTGGVVRRIVAGAAGTLAAAAALWAIWLLVFGGFDVAILGRVVSSNEPRRPLLIAAVGLSIWMLAGADAVVTRWSRRLSRAGTRLAAEPGPNRLAVAVLACIAILVGVMDGSKAADGADSYGYLSEAELFLHGRLAVDEPWVRDVPWPNAIWTFSPLGYKPAPGPSNVTLAGYRPKIAEGLTIVPTYSPGLPLLLAAAKFIAGNAAMFWVVPIAAAVLILATFGLGCRLGSPALGTMAAFLVATNPTVLAYQLVTMTDLPVAAAWTVGIWGLLGTSMASAFAGAAALGVAVLIRPNLVPLLPIVAVWAVVRIVRGAPHRWRHAWRGAIVLAGAAAGLLATMAIYWPAYGSPFESGYGPASGYFSLSYLIPNVRSYTIWLARDQTPVVFLGFLALCLPIARLWPTVRDRSTVLMCALFVTGLCAEFSIYLASGDPSNLRFLLPAFPFLAIGIGGLASWIARGRWPGAAPAAAALVIVLGVGGLDAASRNAAFQHWRDGISMQVGEAVRRATPENSVVLSMQHSGAIRYYAGRMTVRWDNLPADWLDRGVAWMADRGVSTYVLVDPGERDEMRKRFAGQALAARLDAPPAFTLGDRLFYDFSAQAASVVKTTVIPIAVRRGESRPPAPPPTLVWR